MDDMAKFMLMEQLYRELQYVKLDALGLTHLEPLKTELFFKMRELNRKEKNRGGSDSDGGK